MQLSGIPLHNQLMDLPSLLKIQSLQIWSCKDSPKVLYSLISASVSALIPPALSLSDCTHVHNSPVSFPYCAFPFVTLFSLLLFLRVEKNSIQ